MSISVHYTLELQLQGPLLSTAPGAMQVGLDATMQRYQGQPVLNGSLIRGNIRHALQGFAQQLEAPQSEALNRSIKRWFGQESKADLEPCRARVQFDLFWLLQESPQAQVSSRTRITLDDDGNTQDRHLQVVEDVFGSGSQPCFLGTVRSRFDDTLEQADFERWFDKALAFIPALGNQKGVGFGRLLKAELIPCHAPEVDQSPSSWSTADSSAASDTRLGIALRFNFPFCIGSPSTNDSNRIESAIEIPGQVIKAVMAEQYDNDSERLNAELCFDALGVSFARPAKKGLSLPIPLSFAKLGDTLVDMAAVTDVSQQYWEQAPEFQPDWKSIDWVAAHSIMQQSAAQPQRYLLVRTGINADTGQSAQNQLFALECIDPQGFEWLVDFDLSRIAEPQRASVVNNLQTLLAKGLSGIGKTRTHAEVRFREQAMISPQTVQPWRNDQWLVLLVTPTRMFKPGFTCSGINSEAAVRKVYQDYWEAVSGDNLRLLNYFAQQQRVGGEYYHRRFQSQQAYQPEWLTVAGSVFVLQSVDVKQAQDQLQDWMMNGLPPCDEDKANWRTTPYIAEHGYGEIRVNFAPQLDLIKTQEGL